jgi:hypothetical protein
MLRQIVTNNAGRVIHKEVSAIQVGLSDGVGVSRKPGEVSENGRVLRVEMTIPPRACWNALSDQHMILAGCSMF